MPRFDITKVQIFQKVEGIGVERLTQKAYTPTQETKNPARNSKPRAPRKNTQDQHGN